MRSETLNLHSQTALVTGAGSGMGRAIAVSLANAGARVALVGRERAKLEETKREIGDSAEAALVEPCDVSLRDEVGATVERVLARFGGVDILVCNAGINTPRRSLETLDPADWDRLIATNLTGAFNLVHVVLPSMRARGRGLVIQISSIAGIRASVLGGAAYSASKFGQAALGICLGREERVHGIRSSVIYPGEVNTPILDARPVPVDPQRREAILQPEDIASAVLFLAKLPARAHVPELVITPAVDDFV
jgi:NAD(P)-dependent dehydrogenase (short-subunit alcohol dehydrogenase family)